MTKEVNICDVAKREYIKEVISHLESIKSQVTLFATFDLALLALTLSNLIFSEFMNTISLSQKITLSASVILVVISASLYAIWVSGIQALRNKAIDWMVTLDIKEARKIHYPGRQFYKQWGWIYLTAVTLMILGMVGYLVFIILLIFRDSCF